MRHALALSSALIGAAVAYATSASPQDAGAPAVCAPHTNWQARQKTVSGAIDTASQITPLYLANTTAAAPTDVPRMLREMARDVECDKPAIPHHPTMAECDAMPRPVCSFDMRECRRDAAAQNDCITAATSIDPHDTADDLIAKARSLADRIEHDIAAETACRASARCLDERAAATACSALADKRALVDDMARERSNPSGVVDLVTLHELGADIQVKEGIYAAAVADFRAQRHKPFSESLCR